MFFRSLMVLAVCLPAVAQPPAADFEPAGELTLYDALRAALLGNPDLAVYAWEQRVADAHRLQAQLRPNPELSVELEGLTLSDAGTSRSRGYSLGLGPGGVRGDLTRVREDEDDGFFANTEVTLRLAHVIELGGKRAKRAAAATRGTEVAQWDYEVARYELAREVLRRFTDLLAAQARVEQMETLRDLSLRLASTVEARVDAGSASPLEARRARAETARQEIEANSAARDLERARLRLAALWGTTVPRFEYAAGDLQVLPPLPEEEALRIARERVPELHRWSAVLAERQAVLERERANATPDLTLTLGYRAERGTGGTGDEAWTLGTDGLGYSRSSLDTGAAWEHSLVLEASVPLPIWNRNQGNIAAAEARLSQAADARRAAESYFTTNLAESFQDARAARERVVGLEERVLPELETTFALTREGYQLGKFDFLTVLDAERARVQARRDLTQARIDYHLAVARVEGLLGTALENVSAEDMEDPS